MYTPTPRQIINVVTFFHICLLLVTHTTKSTLLYINFCSVALIHMSRMVFTQISPGLILSTILRILGRFARFPRICQVLATTQPIIMTQPLSRHKSCGTHVPPPRQRPKSPWDTCASTAEQTKVSRIKVACFFHLCTASPCNHDRL